MSAASGAMAALRTASVRACTTLFEIRGRNLDVECDAGIEHDPVESPRDRSFVAGEPKSVFADRAGEYQRQPGGAVVKVVERLCVGGGRIGVLDALEDLPRRAGSAAEHRLRRGGAVVQRFDGYAVISSRHQPLFEGRAFERARYQLDPLLVGRRWKFGECRIVCRCGVVAHGTIRTLEVIRRATIAG